MPAEPGPNQPGGKLKIGKDGFLYTVIGDLNNRGQLQNNIEGEPPTDTSVILRIDPRDGSAPLDNPFINSLDAPNQGADNNNQMSKYYAYGIRNSFGLAIDPISGALWEAENGDRDYDEINLVRPGFNSGWSKLMGPLSNSELSQDDLVHFPGSQYADPILSWAPSRGITDIEFFESSHLGERYQNNMMVGDISGGNLYLYSIDDSRTDILLSEGLEDRIANGDDELQSNIIGANFGGITDIETGPDGFLYILTFDQESHGEGKIYRIKQEPF